MAKITLTQLLSALQTSLTRAQLESHIASREYVEIYSSDEVLAKYRIPNFEVESMDIDVSVIPEDVRTIKKARKDAKVLLGTTVVLKQTVLSDAKRKKAVEVFASELNFSTSQTEKILDKLRLSDSPLIVSTDTPYVERIKGILENAGLSVALQAREMPLMDRELVISTDLNEKVTPMLIRLRISPSPLRLIEDHEAPGISYILEPAT